MNCILIYLILVVDLITKDIYTWKLHIKLVNNFFSIFNITLIYNENRSIKNKNFTATTILYYLKYYLETHGTKLEYKDNIYTK